MKAMKLELRPALENFFATLSHSEKRCNHDFLETSAFGQPYIKKTWDAYIDPLLRTESFDIKFGDTSYYQFSAGVESKKIFKNSKSLYEAVSNFPEEDPAQLLGTDLMDDYQREMADSKNSFGLLQQINEKKILKYRTDTKWNIVNSFGINLRTTNWLGQQKSDSLIGQILNKGKVFKLLVVYNNSIPEEMDIDNYPIVSAYNSKARNLAKIKNLELENQKLKSSGVTLPKPSKFTNYYDEFAEGGHLRAKKFNLNAANIDR